MFNPPNAYNNHFGGCRSSKAPLVQKQLFRTRVRLPHVARSTKRRAKDLVNDHVLVLWYRSPPAVVKMEHRTGKLQGREH